MKSQLINEICQLCDTIAEVSLENNERFDQLKKKFPSCEHLQSFEILSGGWYEQQTISTLRKYDQAELVRLRKEAMDTFDRLIEQESELEKLEIKLEKQKRQRTPPSVIKPKPTQLVRDSWDFLLTVDPKTSQHEALEDRMDSLIQTVQRVKNSMQTEQQKAELGQEHLTKFGKCQEDDYQQRYLLERQRNDRIVLLNQQLTAEIDMLKESITYLEYQLQKGLAPDNGRVQLEPQTYLGLINRISQLENELHTRDCPKQPTEASEIRMKKLEELEDKIQVLENMYGRK